MILSNRELVIYHDVVKIKYLGELQLELTFDDGKSGVLDCRPIIEKGGVFFSPSRSRSLQ